MIELILFITALVLLLILAPIGFIFALLPKKGWWEKTKSYLRTIAYAIDQGGNVLCSDLFNWALVRDNRICFGYPDETISSVLGKNKVRDNLTLLGTGLDRVLSKLDANHSIKSIEYNEGIKNITIMNLNSKKH